MSIQLPLPARWAQEYLSRRDPIAELDAIARCKLDAKAEIRLVLERHALHLGVSHRQINAAITGYAEDMLGDLFYEVEREITREIENQDS